MIHGFVHFFVSLPGVFVLAALDSLFFFTLPLGIDAVVMLLAARRGLSAWTTPVLATAGSLIGAAVTYWAGAKLGDKGVGHYAGRKWLQTMKAKLQGSAIALAALDLIPPPFPFSAFVLGAGAVKTDRKKFFVTLAVCRLIRFGGEAWLGRRYGRYAVRWLESETVERVVFALVVLAIAAGLFSLGRLRRARVTGEASTARGRRPGGRSPHRRRSRAFSPSSR